MLKSFRIMPKKIIIICLVVLLALLVILVGFYYSSNKQTLNGSTKTLAQIKQQADFNIYIPKNLPKNLDFSESTISYNQNLLTYTVNKNNAERLTLSQQIKPAQIDINYFNGLRFETNIGKASTNTNDSTISTAIITKDNVLILITSPESVGLDNIKALINSLTTL